MRDNEWLDNAFIDMFRSLKHPFTWRGRDYFLRLTDLELRGEAPVQESDLNKKVERNRADEDISNIFNYFEQGKHEPVGQPEGIIFLLFRFNRFN